MNVPDYEEIMDVGQKLRSKKKEVLQLATWVQTKKQENKSTESIREEWNRKEPPRSKNTLFYAEFLHKHEAKQVKFLERGARIQSIIERTPLMNKDISQLLTGKFSCPRSLATLTKTKL